MKTVKKDACASVREVIERNSGTSADKLLDPGPPPKVHNLSEAARMILKEAGEGTKICVYADYDTDGICSGAILWRLLTKGLNVPADRVKVMFPGRASTGYGFKEPAAMEVIGSGTGLLITADNGISSGTALALVRKAGIRTVIIDHHPPVEGAMADADVIVDPAAQGKDEYSYYCAAGLCLRLSEELGFGNLPGLIELAASATVADVVPLLGDDRRIVKSGLGSINAVKGPLCKGISALKRKLLIAKAGVYDIAFRIGPVINAADRMGAGAGLSFDLLVSDHEDEELAGYLVRLNEERKLLTGKAMERARQKISEERLFDEGPILLAFDDEDGVPEGIAGIVAGRLAEEFKTPAFVAVSGTDGLLKGSARSYAGADIRMALDHAAPALSAYGGHRLAAGFSLKPENTGWAGDLLNEALGTEWAKTPEVLKYDLEITAKDVPSVLDELELFAPLGQGCEPPVFRVRGFRCIPKNGKFCRMLGKDGILLYGTGISASGFGLYKTFMDEAEPKALTLYGTLVRHSWTGCRGEETDDRIDFTYFEKEAVREESPLRKALLERLHAGV